jgi:hypothetical protein
MGHHKFNIGSFFKDVGHKIESVANVPKIVSTIEHTADRGLKTVERVGGSIVNEGKHLVGEAVDGAKGLASSMMMPLMIGGAVVLLILLKK